MSASQNGSAVATPAGSSLPSRVGTPVPNPALGGTTASTGDGMSRIKTLLSILKGFIGKDMANARTSLPSQLLEPIPNLEYWHYLDRPDAFVSIGDSEDPMGRMLQCLRFWFTKDLKYVHGKPCKPYNSTLGEVFRCQWDVTDEHPALLGRETKPNLVTGDATTSEKPVRVYYLTEQTSHHPPVSAYYVDCPEKGVSARGFDQLTATVAWSITKPPEVNVTPGELNHGIFVTLQRWGNEEYQMTHPVAALNGLLTGNLNVDVKGICNVTCEKTGFSVVLDYKVESSGWGGKTVNKVYGVVYKNKEIVGRIEGLWRDKLWFTQGSAAFKDVPTKDRMLLVDVNPLVPVTKVCPPLEQQLPNESRKYWQDVTNGILEKRYNEATLAKNVIEERQRAKKAERDAAGREWQPRFFKVATDPKSDQAIGGRPELTADGREALDRMHRGDWHLEPANEYGSF